MSEGFHFLDGEFDFVVKVGNRPSNGKYQVTLPHQCDSFIVACGPDKAAATAELERFINEAQEALEALKKV